MVREILELLIRSSLGFVLMITAGFFVVLFLVNFGAIAIKAVQMRKWLTINGEVIRSELLEQYKGRTLSGVNIISFKPVIIYEYKLNGKLYHSDCIFADEFQSSDTARGTIARYPPGSTANVYYDPSNPQNAVLEKVPTRLLVQQFAYLLLPSFLFLLLYLYRKG